MDKNGAQVKICPEYTGQAIRVTEISQREKEEFSHV